MTSDKKNISLLANLFVKSGLKNIIISPGSRNAPVVLSFANKPEIVAYSVVDERSAAYMALGMSIQTGKTTAISCTSGSSVLNYAPAIAEAFYQKVPLLVITADRPSYLIDVGDGQTIVQKDVFANYIKESYQLPEKLDTKKAFKQAEDIINKALLTCRFPDPGPVHINVPFDEPIYNTTDVEEEGLLKADYEEITTIREDLNEIKEAVKDSEKVMIIIGQNAPDHELTVILEKFAKDKSIVVLTETTSNQCCEKFIDTIDNIISTIKPEEAETFSPDLLITICGQVVSKMIKRFLRKHQPVNHYHLSKSGDKLDTYLCLTKSIITKPEEFLNTLFNVIKIEQSNYFKLWHDRKLTTERKRAVYLSEIDFSDLKVFDTILKSIPKNSVLHLGNSTPVRYSQLFGIKECLEYHSNRGVSGIDGQVSTAVGFAQNSDKPNYLITGDLGFLYDSNGLMNHYFPKNLKIIIINNNGGGIFRFIPGPDTTPNLEKFFVASHNWNAEHICKAFNLSYSSCDINNYSVEIISQFVGNENDSNVLEIFTPKKENSKILREYFRYIKK